MKIQQLTTRLGEVFKVPDCCQVRHVEVGSGGNPVVWVTLSCCDEAEKVEHSR